MAKKRGIWDEVSNEDIRKKAKSNINKQRQQSDREEGNTRGPKKRAGKMTRLLVKDEDRKKLKLLASLIDKTMIDTFSEVVENALQEAKENETNETN